MGETGNGQHFSVNIHTLQNLIELKKTNYREQWATPFI